MHLYGIHVIASCLLFAVDTILPSYKVLKGFPEIHYFGFDIGMP